MQIDLLAWEPPSQSHSITSVSAASRIKDSAASLRARVLDYIRSCGDEGATDAEIQDALKMVGNTERPRRRELEMAGAIRDSKRTRLTNSGRSAVVWVVYDGPLSEEDSRLDSFNSYTVMCEAERMRLLRDGGVVIPREDERVDILLMARMGPS